MEYFLEGIAPLRDRYINPNEESNKYKSSLELPYQSLNRALPSRKCYNKCKTSIYVLMGSAFNEVND